MHNQFSMSFKSRSWNLQQYCDITEYWWYKCCMQVLNPIYLFVSLWNVDCATTLSSLFLFVRFFFFLCQKLHTIITPKA